MEKLICLREERIHKGCDRRYAGSENCGDKDDLFLSIADGDFAFPEVIRKQVSTLVSSGNMAYEFMENINAKQIIKSYKNHYKIDVQANEILFGNGVLYWLQIAIHVLSNDGDGVIIQPPVYDTFEKIIQKANRQVLKAPLKEVDGKFTIDFKKLEAAFKLGRIFILCSPHNPTGNVWTKSDLIKIMTLAKKHNVFVVSDEIWQDVIFAKKFTSVLELKEFHENAIHVASPAKTFNLGGLQFGIAIIKNAKLRNMIKNYAESVIEYSSSQIWVSKAIQIAYGNKAAWSWFLTYLKQIKKNKNMITKILKDNKVAFANPDGTYLIFAKLGNNKYQKKALEKKLLKRGLHLGMGYIYGPEYDKWVRLNIAICDNSASILTKKLKLIIKDLQS